MTYWYCRECRTVYSEAQMLPGWDGWWCSNCIWNDVQELSAAAPTTGVAPRRRAAASRRSLKPISHAARMVRPRRTLRTRHG
jgi:hypothetical protein